MSMTPASAHATAWPNPKRRVRLQWIPSSFSNSRAAYSLLFVDQILDWYKKNTGKNYEGDDDPGVQSVKKIFNYYKQHGRQLPQREYLTAFPPSSASPHTFTCFENQTGEIKALGGVDFLTISPTLLEELKSSTEKVEKRLDAHAGAFPLLPRSYFFVLFPLTSSAGVAAKADPIPKVSYIDDEPNFRWAPLQEQMAFDKLHEGIKKFAEDGETLKSMLNCHQLWGGS
jgi:transaldolase